MAEFYPSVERWFDAGHVVLDDPECMYPGHGHRWTVRVTCRGSYDAARGSSMDTRALDLELCDIIGQIGGKDLNVMLPAAAPTPEGLGLWLMERLLPNWPKIVEVTVWRDPHRSFSIRREPR